MNKDHNLPIESSAPGAYPHYPAVPPDDEISLVDLWLVLARHRRLIAAIVALTVVLGIAIAALKTDSYSYTTTIQIARVGDGLLEEPVTLLAKLNESYIPFISQQRLQAEPDTRRIKVSAEIPKDSTLILMRSEGDLADQEIHFNVHKQILDRLAQDHNPEVDVIKLSMENDLNRIRNQLDKLKDEALSLQAQGKRLDEQEILLREQLKGMQKLIDISESNRSKALTEVEGEAKAMTLMLIDTETRKYMDREGEIKERLLVGMSADRDRLKNDVADNLRRQTELQEKLREAQAKIVNIRYTRPIVPTLRSLEPHEVGRLFVVLIAGILGLLLGILTALLAEFRLKIKERMHEQVR
ncbi:MAG: hypothetical protein IPK65_09345 [Gammaproteobacteria bacterium]|nr:hypothetical protein [Gammaproteobacteria bacterium]